jgi:hypothetical protein
VAALPGGLGGADLLARRCEQPVARSHHAEDRRVGRAG